MPSHNTRVSDLVVLGGIREPELLGFPVNTDAVALGIILGELLIKTTVACRPLDASMDQSLLLQAHLPR